MDTTTTRYAGSAIQVIALIFGIVFAIVGIAGFVPGLTHSAEHLGAAGAGSEAMLVGLFQVSVLHNIVHLLFAVAGILSAIGPAASRAYLLWGGVVYLVVWIYGLFAVGDDAINIIPVNHADNWLHLGLAIVMILLGLLVGRAPRARPAEAPPLR
ncbi:DUF4383 domain-containing protein [Microbacterium sp. CIAB417]|uniref:DUF4383 domain-containing protein n=1 Tax=Microbacterium sp. CIAB417 TaxID=2860287 RepID=UPI001FABA07B|nr:DUF4383 domain-containing protein [Microbacterium sp. CIAB417]